MSLPVILIFDVGKTNKKIFLFDEQYNIVYEESIQLEETKDEDGFPCEDIDALTKWIKTSADHLHAKKEFQIKAINFSAYGASMVHLGDSGKPLTPLYNYLKPFPEKLKAQFYSTYGGESSLAKQTASPVLGSLNSGLQLYRLKYERPEIYNQIKCSLHLPQYLSFILTSKTACDITSIGCHTHLWNFKKKDYHDWVYKEKLNLKFPSICACDVVTNITKDRRKISAGIGLHDSSSALIPYLIKFTKPFVLLSTGTWCISLNPFNHSVLSDYELHNDCLCYLSYQGKPVKASRLFAGYEHEQQTKRIAEHFNVSNDFYKAIKYHEKLLKQFSQKKSPGKKKPATAMISQSPFKEGDLNDFKNFTEAYFQLMSDIITAQINSTKIILNKQVKKIFVDGGFNKNNIYMHLLAAAFPEMEVLATNIPQASAYGAALAIHKHWNKSPLPDNLIQLKEIMIK